MTNKDRSFHEAPEKACGEGQVRQSDDSRAVGSYQDL